MKNYNPTNVRIKHQYFNFLGQAKQQDESTIDAVAKAISRFEEYTNHCDFKKFHHQQAASFKKNLTKQKNVVTGKPLSKSTMHSTLRNLKTFFQWLAMQTGYKSRIDYTDTEYFNLSGKDTRIATAKSNKPVPTTDQINYLLKTMPTNTLIEQRNRALIALTFLTGARDGAIASLKLKHVDLLAGRIIQDAKEVNTKFSKTFNTYFFPVGELPLTIVTDWVNKLITEELFSLDDPLFPRTKIENNKNKKFEACGLTRENWLTATPIRKIFKIAFASIDAPYFNPHSFRKTLTRLSQTMCRTPEEVKAWSQNLGHEALMTTFYNYGEIEDYQQGELIRHLNKPRLEQSPDMQAIIEATIKKMQNEQ